MHPPLQSIVEQAAKVLAPFWPLQSFIAINPLQNFTSLTFHDAIDEFNRFRPLHGFLPLQTYQRYYQQNKISTNDLGVAMTQFLNEQRRQGSGQLSKELAMLKKQLLNASNHQKERDTSQSVNGTLAQQIDRQYATQLTQKMNDHLLRWLPAFFDQGQASWLMPNRKQGLFMAWKSLAINEWPKKQRQWLANLPDQSETVLVALLTAMEVPSSDWSDFLSAHLVALIGWASFIKWAGSRRDVNLPETGPASLIDYLAMRLCIEWMVLEQCVQVKEITYPIICRQQTPVSTHQTVHSLHQPLSDLLDVQRLSIWQTAYEQSYQRELRTQINDIPNRLTRKDYSAQVIFCIDSRSEGLRRHFESQGPYQTFGFAGFFGFAFRYLEGNQPSVALQCPALLQPNVVVQAINHHTATATDSLISIRERLKGHWLAPFVLFEAIGAWFLLKLIGKTVFPRFTRRFIRRQNDKVARHTTPKLLIEKTVDNLDGYSWDQLTDIAESVCRTIGLTQHFSHFVLLCAHHSLSENNPYESSLDCGACGGHSGIPNAKVAVTVFNHPIVRGELKKRGIDIPTDCLFIVGCHNTTTDDVQLLDVEHCPDTHRQAIFQLQADLKYAGSALCRERMATLSGDKKAKRRQANWAELAPELGQINNAAFIIGPRALTQGCDLKQRVFLHCYDHQQDHDGKLLEAILVGPLMVAHWINMQYYFSTVDPDLFGSGNKAIHNVVANIGVMAGNQSNLKLGLPQQSLFYRDQCLHEPLRLYVLINAPKTHVNNVLSRCAEVQQLINNHWIQLEVIANDKSLQ